MDISKQTTPLDVFLNNYSEAEAYLKLYGDKGTEINKGVTLSYANIAVSDPLFMWFSAATLGSAQVGRTIALSEFPILKNCQSTQTLSQGFMWGNQAIHNSMTAIYFTYKELGISGLQEIFVNDPNEKYISQNVIVAFEVYSKIEQEIQAYAKSQNLSPTDLNVINHILKQPENFEILKNASMALVAHEQNVVSLMYNQVYIKDYKTVGEVLSDTSYLEKLAANGIGISGAKILDKYISVDGYDFNSYDSRMAYFETVFDEYFLVLSQDGGLERLIAQRDEVIAGLCVDFIEYGTHFVVDHSEDFVFFKDLSPNRWKIVANYELPDLHSAPPCFESPPPGCAFLPKDYPILEDSFFYKDNTHQVFGITESWISNSPPRMFVDGSHSSTWTVVKHIWVPRDIFRYDDLPGNPHWGNYNRYILWEREKRVSKAELLSWLGNFEVEDPDFIYPEITIPEPVVVPDASFASNIHNYTYVLRSPNLNVLRSPSLKKTPELQTEDFTTLQEKIHSKEVEVDQNTITPELINLVDSDPIHIDVLNYTSSSDMGSFPTSIVPQILELKDIILDKFQDILQDNSAIDNKIFLMPQIEVDAIQNTDEEILCVSDVIVNEVYIPPQILMDVALRESVLHVGGDYY